MKVQTPAPQIAPQPGVVAPRTNAPRRRLGAGDLADLTQTPAVGPSTARAPSVQAETRPLRPGSVLDIKA